MQNNLIQFPHVKFLLSTLSDHGIDARIVGGAVRDYLLGRPLHDMDIAVSAPPKIVMETLSPLCKIIPTGIKHGTFTAVFDDTTFEITTLREDIQTNGRHAEVIYGTSFEKDAARRDFTINALSMDDGGNIYDYFGGRDDLENGRVRFIGDATTRIREDYLRILRFFRMHAFFGKGDMDVAGLRACAQEKMGLHILSRERIGQEFFKILHSPDTLYVLANMHTSGILFEIYPHNSDISACAKMIGMQEKFSLFSHMRVLRIFSLYHRNLSHLSKAFVLGRKESALLQILQKYKDTFFNYPPKELLYRLGKEIFFDLTLLCASISSRDPEAHIQLARTWTIPTFPLKSKDFPHLSGKELGDALKKSEEAWIKAEFGVK